MTVSNHFKVHDVPGWSGQYSKTFSERLPLTDLEELKLTSYFKNRSERLKIAATTITPLAQILDWIVPETQCGGRPLASPPPPLERAAVIRGMDDSDFIRFELENPEVERGPQGTIPVLRRGLSDLRFIKNLEKILVRQSHQPCGCMLDKNHLTELSENRNGPGSGSMLQNTHTRAGQALLFASEPEPQPDGFEVGQICLLRKNKPDLQSVEAGLIEHPNEEGGRVAHLFTHYSTRGDCQTGDAIGGFNQGVTGWIQVSNSIYPSGLSNPIHIHPHTRYITHFQYQLYQENWWLAVNCHWIGYYPARLFRRDGLREKADLLAVSGKSFA